jgi:hypothetical protein
MKKFLSKPLNLILTILIILAIVVAISQSITHANNQADAKRADEIAKKYQPQLDDYKKRSDAEIKAQAASVNSEESAKIFAGMIDAKIKSLPEIQSVNNAYVYENSKGYKTALSIRDGIKNSYEELALYARGDLASRYKYLATVQSMLDMKVSDYLGNTQVMDGTPVREKLIPPYQSALDAFMKLPIPKGQEVFAKNVRNTYGGFVSAAADAAKKLDAKESFSFDFSKEFTDLQGQVNTERSSLQDVFLDRVNQTIK